MELFFSTVCAAGGFNNNPTAQQFMAAYKRLLFRSTIKGGQGNVSRLDNTTILDIVGDSCKTSSGKTVTISEAALIRKYDLQECPPAQTDHDYCDAPNIVVLSEYKSAAISYIAGYVANMSEKKIICSQCSNALKAPDQKPLEASDFVQFKSRGGLTLASSSVRKVCEETENCFACLLAATSGKLPRGQGVPDAISTAVLGSLKIEEIFPELNEHMIDTSATDNHIFQLVKEVAKCYCKIRPHHLAKQTTQQESGLSVRKELSKLVLFKHQ